MPISLIAVESFPVYEPDGVGGVTSTDHDFGTIQFVDSLGNITSQVRVLMSDLNLGGLSVDDARAAVEAAGPQFADLLLTVNPYLSADFGAFALTGQPVVLKCHSKLIAGVGSFALNGQPVNLS
jgi:hypothetical protein